MKKFKIVFDTETTGVDVNNDRIVEISILKINNDLEIVDELYFLLNPQIAIPQGASDVHGITNEQVKNSPVFKDVAKKIVKFIKNCDLVGFNSDRFDIPLLLNEFKRVNIDFNISDISTIDVYKFEVKGVKNTLSDVYRRHMKKELDDAHGAKADTMATLEILKSQLNKTNMSIDEVESFLLDGKPRLDLGGKLKYNEDGHICWNFGKYKNEKINIDSSYTEWVLSKDFPSDLKTILERYA